MHKANRQFNRQILILAIALALFTQVAWAIENMVPPYVREIAVQQGFNALKGEGQADLGPFVNMPLIKQELNMSAGKEAGVSASIRAVVGGRNFTAADVDFAQIPFSTLNGYGITPLYHDGGEWPGTAGDPATDDGQPGFGTDWHGEIYDVDGNNHYPKAVLRYIGTHCYIFVPVMYFPTLPRGMSATEEPTPAARPEWGLYWPDSPAFSNGPYYYAPGANGTVVEPRFVMGSDKNLARLKLKALADQFDGIIYPKIREYYGNEPDVDGDPKIFILLDDIRDGSGSFRGYFWAANQLPRSSQAMSNEKELLYIDLFPSFVMHQEETYGTVAHEFVHMVVYNEHYKIENGQLLAMDRWLEEGLTTFAEHLLYGDFSTNLDAFFRSPDTILADDRVNETWLGANPFANYGASFLWMYYLTEKYGGSNLPAFLRNIIRHPSGNMEAIDAVLKPFNTDAETVFTDWAIANYLNKTRRRDGALLNDGKWGYNRDNDMNSSTYVGKNERLPVKFSEKVLLSDHITARSANVNPWAADYIEISGNTGNLNLGFDGDDKAMFRAGLIKRGPDIDPSVEFFYLNDKQAGNLIIQNYGAGNTYENLVLVPMVTNNFNYQKMNYVYSGSFDDLKVALFPNPTFENHLHVVVRTEDKFAAEPRVQLTFEGQQGYLTMVPINESTYISNYTLDQSGEGTIVANGTNKSGTILSNNLKFSAVYYPPNSQGWLNASFLSLNIPLGSLRQGGTVIVAEPENPISYEGLQRISTNYDVALPVEKSESPIEVVINLENSLDFDVTKAALYRASSSGPKMVSPVTVAGKKATGMISTSASVFVAVDDVPPSIAQQAATLGNGWLSLSVADGGSGVDPDSVKVNYYGAEIPVTVNEEGVVKINAASLRDGEYDFEIEVADRAGNLSRSTIRALVAGKAAMTQVTAYPNPARAFSNIRASFKGTDAAAVDASVRIFDVKGHRVTDLPIPHRGSGVYEVRWYLDNSKGDLVANGVYFAEIKVNLGNESRKERIKIAVLR